MSPFLIMKLKIEESENINDQPNYIPTNIFYPNQWKTIDIKLRDLLVENGLINLISNFTSQKVRKINFNWKKYVNL